MILASYFQLRHKFSVYLAGKISHTKENWRTVLFGNQRGLDAEEALNFDTCLYIKDDLDFVMTGPFFVGCDHGCAHGEGLHGVGTCMDDGANLRKRSNDRIENNIYNINMTRIKRAKLVFAYINELDCFGTISEIGFAAALGKEVHICYGPSLTSEEKRELWFVEQHANEVWHLKELKNLRDIFEGSLKICKISAHN